MGRNPSSQHPNTVYTIGNPQDVPPGRNVSTLGPGYVDFVCHGGQWYILSSSCSQGFVPPAGGPGSGGQCYPGSVVRCACVPGTDSAHAQALINAAQQAAANTSNTGGGSVT